jgi:hypothetical protein
MSSQTFAGNGIGSAGRHLGKLALLLLVLGVSVLLTGQARAEVAAVVVHGSGTSCANMGGHYTYDNYGYIDGCDTWGGSIGGFFDSGYNKGLS